MNRFLITICVSIALSATFLIPLKPLKAAPLIVANVPQNITWTNLVKCTVSGGILSKNAGLNDSPDAGANSLQQINSGDGYVEFSASGAAKNRYLGLTKNYAGVGYKSMNFALHLTTLAQGGGFIAEARENNVYKSGTTYTSGSIFRIAIEAGVVKFYRDGTVFYTSPTNPVYPLVVDTTLLDLNGEISNAVIANDTTTTPPPTVDTTSPVLSQISSSGISTSGASITWLTNEIADSQVDYGTTIGYGSVKTLATMTTGHQIDLTGLATNTTYNYRVKSKDASGNLATSGNYTFITGQLNNAGTVAGRLDDGLIHLPTNYSGWTPPAVGGDFTDSAYGTTITRLSNGQAQLAQGVHHEYATMSPFNSDNSRILLLGEDSGFYVVDRAGNIISSPSQTMMSGYNEPRWSTTNPNIFYYHSGNQIFTFDVATKQKSVVRAFTQFTAITFGGGESDISEDGNHLVIIGDKKLVGVYTISTNILSSTLDISTAGGFDYFDMTANNNVIVRWGLTGTGRFRGFELYDQNMNFMRQVITYAAHGDRGRDLNGDEVLFVLGSSDPAPPAGCENNGVEKIRLSDSRKTCIMPLDWYQEAHISANSNGRNPWVLVSVTDTNFGTADGTLPADWQSRWKVKYNEAILVKVDGSEVRHLAHHRTRVLDDYWFEPRAAISRDGIYAIYDSNFGIKPFAYYTDAFLLHLMNGQ